MAAFSILLALAITSTTGWVRRLKKNWQRLHRLVYVAAVAGVVHFIWIQKSDFRVPFRCGILAARPLRASASASTHSEAPREHVPKPVTA